MNRYMTVGVSALAAAALFEAALVPGMVIGGSALVATRYLRKLRRLLRPAVGSTACRRIASLRCRIGRRSSGRSPFRAGLP